MEILVAIALCAGLIWLVWQNRRPRDRDEFKPDRSPPHIEGDGEFDFDVVGEASYQDALDAIAGGKTEDGHDLQTVARLVREPDNPHDHNAVAVFIDGRKVGYISRREAAEMSDMMVRNSLSEFTVDALIIGGWSGKCRGEGHYGVKLDLPA